MLNMLICSLLEEMEASFAWFDALISGLQF